MANMEIVIVPSDTLRRKAIKIKKIDKSINKLINNMTETLRGLNGVGLAAPQVGESIKLIIVESRGNKRKNGEEVPIIPLTILINPEIIKTSKEKSCEDEGCFSVPGIWGSVERPTKITLKALDRKGNQIKIRADGLFARALQHEIDHLNGVLFTDKADINTLHKIGPNGEKIKIEL